MQPPNRQVPKNRRTDDATPTKLPAWDASVGEFLREKKRANIRPATLGLYRDCLNGRRAKAWREMYGINGTADITRETLRSLQVDLQEAKLSASTVHIYHRVFKTFVRFCREEGYEVGERADMVPAPAAPIETPQPFTREDEKRLVEAARTGRDRFLIEFLLSTGLRLGEACQVEIEDIMEAPEEPGSGSAVPSPRDANLDLSPSIVQAIG